MNARIELALLSCLVGAGCTSTADLRPPEMIATAPTPDAEQQGHQLLAQMVAAHGGIDKWRSYNFMHAKVQDAWFSKLIFALIVPFDDNPEHVVVAAYTDRLPDGRLELPGGGNAGQTWAVKNGRLTTKALGEPAETVPIADEAIRSTLTVNFFFWPGMPFYLGSADKVTYLGRETIDGKTYDKIFASWTAYGPQTDKDQWVCWIDSETKLLSHVHFTARMAGMSQEAFIRSYAYTNIQGMKIAMKYDGSTGLGDDPIHTYSYSDIAFSRRAYVDLMKDAP